MTMVHQAAALALCSLFLASSSWGEQKFDEDRLLPAKTVASQCDPGQLLTAEERAALFAKVRATSTGRSILDDYARHFGSLSNLVLQWDSVSYSQVVSVPARELVQAATEAGAARAPAGVSPLGNAVCIHLTQRLPAIEHVADLTHELAHATRLSPEVLRGDVRDVETFVRARLTARGGEADAFAAECRVKNELLGRWDELCAPYASSAELESFDTKRVVSDLYSGRLSASLTGETYPVMLARQFKAMLAKRARLQYATNPYARK